MFHMVALRDLIICRLHCCLLYFSKEDIFLTSFREFASEKIFFSIFPIS